MRTGGNGQRGNKLGNFLQFSQGGTNSGLPRNHMHRLVSLLEILGQECKR